MHNRPWRTELTTILEMIYCMIVALCHCVDSMSMNDGTSGRDVHDNFGLWESFCMGILANLSINIYFHTHLVGLICCSDGALST